MSKNMYKMILLVIGSSQTSNQAAKLAIDMAEEGGATLILLHVVDKMLVNRMNRITGKSLSEIEVEMEENGWKYLYHFEDTAKSRGIPVMIHQANGVIENEILNHANRFKCDLIVMAYPEKVSGQMNRLAKGHIERTVENANCSVLIFK